MTQYIDTLNVEGNLTNRTYSPVLTTTTTSTSGMLTLSSSSSFSQVTTGSASGYVIRLPNATTLTSGWKYEIWNQASTVVALQYADGTFANPIPPTSFLLATMQADSTTNGSWLFFRAFTGTASGILNYTISTAASFTLSTGTADVLITSMTVTPIAGTYAIWYNGSISITGNNTVVRTSIYYGGSIWSDSLRNIGSSVSTFVTQHSTMAVIQVDGTKTIEARVARDSNSLLITGRSLILIRIGD